MVFPQYLLILTHPTLRQFLQLIWQSLLKIWGSAEAGPTDFADGVAVLSSQVLYYGLLIHAYWRDTLPNWR